MRLFITFSARNGGNCDQIAKYLAKQDDKIIYFRSLNAHNCSNCDYECFAGACKFRNDDIYNLYSEITRYQKVVLIVPMYCGNPSSLYFTFNERSQDYFSTNEDKYESFIKRLFIIGIYGSADKTSDFIPCFEKWFKGFKYTNHVLGIERHKYELSLKDSIFSVKELSSAIDEFINPSTAKVELSVMPVVMCNDNILTTNEMIFGTNSLSLPKGHCEKKESLIETAIRECFEETNVIISKDNFVKELQPYSYEFLTPSNKLVKKTIVPLLFKVNDLGNPMKKEKNILSVQWMTKSEFIKKCSYKNVKEIVKELKND